MDQSDLSKSELRRLKREEKKREKREKKQAKAEEQKLDFLIREEKRNKLCLARTKNEIEKWIETLAVDELRDDVFNVARALDRSIDKSQHAIEVIENHRQHADEQYERNFRDHLKLITHIEEIFKVFYDSARRMYEIERENLVKDFFDENSLRESMHDEKKLYYENYAHATVTLTKRRLNEMKVNFEEDKIDIHAENVIQSENLQLKYNQRMKMACIETKRLIDFFTYRMSLDDKFEEYEKTLAKQEAVESAIKDQKVALEVAKVKIRSLEDELKNHEFFRLSNGNRIKSEKNFLQKLFHELNEQMKSDLAKDQKRIELLVALSNKVQKKFDNKHEKLEKIQNLVNLVRKHERICDFVDLYDDDVGTDENFLEDELMKKVGRVQATNLMLENEKKYLTEKNMQIAKKIIDVNVLKKVEGNSDFIQSLSTCPAVSSTASIQHANLIPQIRQYLTQLTRNS